MKTRTFAAAVATAALTLGLVTACGGEAESVEATPSTTTRTVYLTETETETVTQTVEVEPSPTSTTSSEASDDGQMINDYRDDRSTPAGIDYAPSEPEPVYIAPEVASTSTYYENCTAVRAAGAAPIYRGSPGYDTHLDRDRDGIGCEN